MSLNSGKRNLCLYRIMTWNKLIPVLLALALLFAFLPAPTQAAGNVYYIAKNGSNSNPGTEAQPWLTIQKAASTLVAGDTVYVKAGTYNERIKISNSGSAGNVITYAAYPGDTPIIDGTGINLGGDPNGLVETNGKSYITIDGFEIRNAVAGCGLRANGDTHYITFKNCTIHNTAYSGIQLSYNGAKETTVSKVTHITVDNCTTYSTNTATGDECFTIISVDTFEIKNCHVSNSGSIGICWKDLSKNGSIHDNVVHDTGGDAIYGFSYNGDDSSNIDIYNNLCYNQSIGAGICLNDEGNSGGTMTNCNIYNNIIYNCLNGITTLGCYLVNVNIVNNTIYAMNSSGSSCIKFYQNHSYYSNVVVRNNIMVAIASAKYLMNYADYAAGGVTIDHNLYYDSTGAYSFNPSGVIGANSIKANPLLASPTSNFHISSGSPAIDAGSSSNAPSFDYANAARPQGAGYDIGAYEYQSGPSSDPQPQPQPGDTTTNKPPVLAAIGNKTVNAGQTLTFQISATDPNGNSLTYSASNLPSGSSFNTSTRTFSWTPTSSQAGTYSNVRFTVSDGSLTDYENITITVNSTKVNHDPVLTSISDRTVYAGQTITFAISATDPDGDSLTYSASNLPSGASFSASTKRFSWTPTFSQVGTYNLVFSVTDGKVTKSDSVMITVRSRRFPGFGY